MKNYELKQKKFFLNVYVKTEKTIIKFCDNEIKK